jgi:hypothetical protein
MPNSTITTRKLFKLLDAFKFREEQSGAPFEKVFRASDQKWVSMTEFADSASRSDLTFFFMTYLFRSNGNQSTSVPMGLAYALADADVDIRVLIDICLGK